MIRESKWELLRAISCLSVVLLHVAALFTEDASVYRNYPAYVFSFCDFFQIITRTAVPCFVMLSGAFLLDKKELDSWSFYKNSIRKLIVPTILFLMLFMGIRLIKVKKVSVLFTDLIYGTIGGHLWFMYMLIGLYAVFPFIFYFKQNVKKSEFIIFSCFMVVLSCLVHFTCKLIWPIEFLEYLGYFLMGYQIRNNGKKIWGSAFLWMLISFTFLILTYLLNERQFVANNYNPSFFRNPNFPTVIIASLAIFISFSKMEIPCVHGFFLKIARHSMVIYMLHPLILNIACKIIKPAEFSSGSFIFVFVPVMFIVCLSITYLGAICIDNFLFRFGIRKK